MRILLAIDGSPCSKVAVEEVRRRPWPEGSEVRLLTVRSPIEAMLLQEASHLPMPGELIFKQSGWREVDFMNDALARLESSVAGLRVTPILLEGRAKDVILDDAEQWGADLIVVGSHGYGIVRHFLLGSVSLAVALNAPCSVEIVRSRDDRPRGDVPVTATGGGEPG
ncbi:universal stress protein [Trichlorobacter ammonificans]|uniref:Nucleotide-binding universal stress protein, UspA family n=1 Tax=Trichlorobacter ammonificans TaxID=2916410 RepID=A0ABM9D8K2_9BACT|nr:universal stress protein [Trichlorobacter ammonificans]CAH2030711.1 Nucleotide-binding universal stress protein, UspA family [Trichlorobacter ammonificans]